MAIFGEKAERIETLEADLQASQDEVEGLKFALEVGETLAVQAARELRDQMTMGQFKERAIHLADISIRAAEDKRLTDEMAENLKEERYEATAARYRAEEGPAIRQKLDEVFTTDGTYEAVDQAAQDDVFATIQAEVFEERKAAAKAEFDTPEARETFTSQAREVVAQSPELKDHRARVVAELESVWKEEVVAEVKEKITDEEKAREDEYKSRLRGEYLASDWAKKLRTEAQSKFEREWTGATKEAVAQEVKHTELTRLLKEKADQEAAKLADELAAKELLKQFTGRGVPVGELKQDDKLDIYLGEIVTEEVTENVMQGGYRQSVKTMKDVVHCARKITLIAHGDGKFMIQYDSLSQSGSVYERSLALSQGTLVALGRKISDNGHEEIEHLIAADVPLIYDQDTTDDVVSEGLLPLVNVRVNGILARNIRIDLPKKVK